MQQKFINNKRGFTIVELLVVITIMGILSTVLVMGYSKYITKSKVIANEQELLQIKQSFDLAMIENKPYEIVDEDNQSKTIILTTYEDLAALDLKVLYEKITGNTLEAEIALTYSENKLLYTKRGITVAYDVVSSAFTETV